MVSVSLSFKICSWICLKGMGIVVFCVELGLGFGGGGNGFECGGEALNSNVDVPIVEGVVCIFVVVDFDDGRVVVRIAINEETVIIVTLVLRQVFSSNF